MERTGDEFLNVSEAGSPRRAVSSENVCFYSVPTSPTRKSFKSSASDHDHDHDQPTTPPNAYEDANSSFSDFEFETSRRFNVSVIAADHDDTTGDGCWKQQVQQNNNQRKEFLPAMAFADELFYNGIVMPTLKPPPARLRYSNDTASSSSLSSPTARLKLPFARRSLWNDDFDPFLAALENVKLKEEKENGQKFHTPLRAFSPQELDNKTGQDCFEEKISKRVLAEPKGVFYARQLVKMGQEKPGKEGGASPVGKKKRKKIKKFLLRSASMTTTLGRSSKVHEHHDDIPKDDSAALPKAEASFTRKLSFTTKGLAQYYNGRKGCLKH
ncbi:hypothetical protein AB3S75_010419 [Citrus x aurantiifolia]